VQVLTVSAVATGGGFVAGMLGLLAHEALPVFHWELAGLTLILIPLIGGVMTAAGVGSGRGGSGILVGARPPAADEPELGG
jgi:hypothetical protein